MSRPPGAPLCSGAPIPQAVRSDQSEALRILALRPCAALHPLWPRCLPHGSPRPGPFLPPDEPDGPLAPETEASRAHPHAVREGHPNARAFDSETHLGAAAELADDRLQSEHLARGPAA